MAAVGPVSFILGNVVDTSQRFISANFGQDQCSGNGDKGLQTFHVNLVVARSAVCYCSTLRVIGSKVHRCVLELSNRCHLAAVGPISFILGSIVDTSLRTRRVWSSMVAKLVNRLCYVGCDP